MIDYDNLTYDMFGNVILTDAISCRLYTLREMVDNPNKRTEQWKEIIRELEDMGIITE